MRSRRIALVTASLIFAVIFARLGFWQIQRLREKQSYNLTVAARRFFPPVPFDSLPNDIDSAKLRRISVEGRLDYDSEIVWTLRGRNGSPGVNILTPLIRQGTDTVVLVDRGWVYSPNATAVDLSRWKEGDFDRLEGYVLPLQAVEGSFPPGTQIRTHRALDRKVLSRELGRPVASMFIILSTPPVDSIHSPPRVTLVPLDEGSHRSYAFQWFSFAAISIIGAGIFLQKT